ncbi:hypothetical protein L6164_020902 [Bauhinia variegata]|uniref:Uncharacterized protein n=1 Tax=Bauhinia variegata TaxID=167791 RepID=A0ACB9MWG8_BAUVA|nr:hypothetical protein L6164_020902 [Bauhinia variegata]
MAKNPSKLAEVDCSSETWKLPIRVTSMWKVFKFGKMQSLDMVFMDEDGSKMLASIHHSMVDKFKHLLEEGKTYIVTNLEVFNVDDGQHINVKRKNTVSPMVEFNLLDLKWSVSGWGSKLLDSIKIVY